MTFNGNLKQPQIAMCLMGACALVFGSSWATAQDETGGATYVDKLKECQSVAEDAARLRCYDTAVGEVVTASDEGEVQIIDSEDIRKTRRGLFGFSLPKIDLFGGDEEDETLQSVVTRVRIEGRNTVFLTVEDGDAVWRIPGADRRVMRTKRGDRVEFKRAAMGSYFIRINGRNGVKGRRVK